MASEVKTFLEAIKTDIEAVSGVNVVHITPAADAQYALRIPRFPMVLVNDGGGELSPHNGKLQLRILEVTIIVNKPRDHSGEQATLELLEIGDDIISAIEWSDDDGVFLAADSDVTAESIEEGVVLIQKTYSFEYQIQRT